MDLRKLQVYVISVGEGKYQQRLDKTLQRLRSHGFENIHHVPSVPDPNPTNSLSRTNQLIFEKEKNKTEPFLVVEDDIQFSNENLQYIVSIPPNASALYIGVSGWVYPYDYESLTQNRQHIRSLMETDLMEYNETWVEIKGMTSAHAILYMDRDLTTSLTEKIQDHLPLQTPHDLILATLQHNFKMYALKTPMVYQDASQGGQEDVTRLVWKNHQYKRKLE